MSSIGEDEIMGLYALAREELKSVSGACHRLEKTIQHLEGAKENIEFRAQQGIRESLGQFEREVKGIIGNRISNAATGLERAVEYASYRLRKIEYAYGFGIFILGILIGVGLMLWWFSERLSDVESNQRSVYWAVMNHQKTTKVKHGGR